MTLPVTVLFVTAEVNVCGQDCTRQAQWINAKRIVCVSGNVVGLGEVIITTRSGGRGTCCIRFRGLPPVVNSEYFYHKSTYIILHLFHPSSFHTSSILFSSLIIQSPPLDDPPFPSSSLQLLTHSWKWTIGWMSQTTSLNAPVSLPLPSPPWPALWPTHSASLWMKQGVDQRGSLIYRHSFLEVSSITLHSYVGKYIRTSSV